MKHVSLAMAVAIGMLAGCGGGGSGSNNTGGPPSTGEPTMRAPVDNQVVAGVAIFSGPREQYGITRLGSGFTVVNKRTNASSSIVGAQSIRFSDITVDLGIGDKAASLDAARLKTLVELYMAFLKRVPDADSLGGWIVQVNAGQTWTQIADRLHAEAVLAPGITGISTSMLHADFVAAVYKDVFGMSGATAPAGSDLAYWSSRIDKGGISRGALVLAMLEAARTGYPGLSSPAVTGLLDNRNHVADVVAIQQGINYNAAEESLARRQAIFAAVTSTDTSAALSLLGFSDAAFNLRMPGK